MKIKLKNDPNFKSPLVYGKPMCDQLIRLMAESDDDVKAKIKKAFLNSMPEKDIALSDQQYSKFVRGDIKIPLRSDLLKKALVLVDTLNQNFYSINNDFYIIFNEKGERFSKKTMRKSQSKNYRTITIETGEVIKGRYSYKETADVSYKEILYMSFQDKEYDSYVFNEGVVELINPSGSVVISNLRLVETNNKAFDEITIRPQTNVYIALLKQNCNVVGKIGVSSNLKNRFHRFNKENIEVINHLVIEVNDEIVARGIESFLLERVVREVLKGLFIPHISFGNSGGYTEVFPAMFYEQICKKALEISKKK